MSIILNIEADEILYRSAFATEKQGYKIITHKGAIRDFGNRYTKTQILAKIQQLKLEDYTLAGYKILEPLEHALFLVKRNMMKFKQIGEPVLWLSPSDGSNFRFARARTPGSKGVGYKAGRPPRPVYYQEIRDYLVRSWGATEITGYEADDALGMYQTDNTVAVHIDKDISMIVGKHYHWVKSERYIVDNPFGQLPTDTQRGTGKAFFFHQMLTGDNVDNIPGIPKIGPVKATKLLSKCKNEREMFDIVKEIYYNVYKEEAENILYEIADLLYIVDSEKQTGTNYLHRLNL